MKHTISLALGTAMLGFLLGYGWGLPTGMKLCEQHFSVGNYAK